MIIKSLKYFDIKAKINYKFYKLKELRLKKLINRNNFKKQKLNYFNSLNKVLLTINR